LHGPGDGLSCAARFDHGFPLPSSCNCTKTSAALSCGEWSDGSSSEDEGGTPIIAIVTALCVFVLGICVTLLYFYLQRGSRRLRRATQQPQSPFAAKSDAANSIVTGRQHIPDDTRARNSLPVVVGVVKAVPPHVVADPALTPVLAVTVPDPVVARVVVDV